MSIYRIEYGDSKMEGGLFLRQKLSPTASLDYTDGEGECFKHLSTFSQRSTIKEQLIEMLDNAKRYIFFTSFMIQDKQLVDCLIAASRRLKGHVYVLTTLKDQDFNILIAQQDDANDDQWNFKEHIDCIKELVRHGISVKARRDCHAKFAVSDDKQVIVTSANAVPTCFENIQQKSGHLRDANPENGVLLEIPSEVNRMANFFRAIWRSAHNYYVAPNSQLFGISEINKNIILIRCKEPGLTSDLGKIIWTAPNDLRILNEISSMIDSAQEKITISSWVIKGIATHVLGEKLSQAAKRGVDIEILLRGMYRSDHRESCSYLKETLGDQVLIRGDFCNHSKAVLVDNNKAMIMSANIDAQHGLDSSVEVGFVSQQPDFVRCVGHFLNRLHAGCELEFVMNPTQHQAAQGYPTFLKTIMKNEMSLHFDPKLKHRERIIKKLISEMSHQLMRLSHRGKDGQKVTLLTNSMIMDCVQNKKGECHVQHVVETPAARDRRFQYLLPKMTIEIHFA